MAQNDLKDRAMGLLNRAMEKVLSDEERAAKVARAVGAAQRGKERLDQAQEKLLRSLGIASRSDYKEIAKRVSALKRRARHLAESLEK